MHKEFEVLTVFTEQIFRAVEIRILSEVAHKLPWVPDTFHARFLVSVKS